MKNLKINNKKILSIISALMLSATPAVANATSQNNSNESVFHLVKQEVKKEPRSMNTYSEGVEKSYNYLKNYIDYDHMLLDVECAYYLINREYISSELEQELINSGYVF